MSVNDPVVLVCQPGHPKPYYLTRGRETFYVRCDDTDDPQHWKTACWNCDHLDEHIRFKTDFEAVEWAVETLGVSPHDHLPEETRARNKQRQQAWIDAERQLDLF